MDMKIPSMMRGSSSPSSMAKLKTLLLFVAPWIQFAPNSTTPSPWAWVNIRPPSRSFASSTLTLESNEKYFTMMLKIFSHKPEALPGESLCS